MGSRVVFVGNIPYDVTEPQLISVMEEAGTVVSFKLVFDRDTGKSKGYAFCTFPDPETAASAVRNLSGREINGRPLKLDFADTEKDFDDNRYGGPQSHQQYGGGRFGRRGDQQPPMHHQQQHGGLPPHQQQQQQQQVPQQSAIETINQVINAMQPQHLAELLSYFKFMVQSNPDQCRALLQQQPQLAYTLFQTLLKMNIIDQFAMQRILQAQMSAPAPSSAPLHSSSAVPHGMGGPSPMSQHPPPAPIPSAPPVQTMPPQPAAAGQDPQQVLLMQLLSLTAEQIQALPPAQQQQILQLRAQVMGGLQQ